MTATDPLLRLTHIEAIKQLKARYFRLMDTKQWADYREVFTDDMVFQFETQDEAAASSGDDFVAFVKGRLSTAVTVHQGHMPEIDITSDTTATGVWAMYDWVDDPDHDRAFQGFGHYHEDYRLGADGRWRIAKLHLTRLRVDPLPPTTGEVGTRTPAVADASGPR